MNKIALHYIEIEKQGNQNQSNNGTDSYDFH